MIANRMEEINEFYREALEGYLGKERYDLWMCDYVYNSNLSTNSINKWREGDDPEMKTIYNEEMENSKKMFEDAVNQEKAWAQYLFKDGSMIGLSEKLLSRYVEWIANRRMTAIGISPVYDIAARNNPLPWTEHWIKSKGVQVAPQETEVESYLIGGVKQDIKENAFSGFKL